MANSAFSLVILPAALTPGPRRVGRWNGAERSVEGLHERGLDLLGRLPVPCVKPRSVRAERFGIPVSRVPVLIVLARRFARVRLWQCTGNLRLCLRNSPGGAKQTACCPAMMVSTLGLRSLWSSLEVTLSVRAGVWPL